MTRKTKLGDVRVSVAALPSPLPRPDAHWRAARLLTAPHRLAFFAGAVASAAFRIHGAGRWRLGADVCRMCLALRRLAGSTVVGWAAWVRGQYGCGVRSPVTRHSARAGFSALASAVLLYKFRFIEHLYCDERASDLQHFAGCELKLQLHRPRFDERQHQQVVEPTAWCFQLTVCNMSRREICADDRMNAGNFDVCVLAPTLSVSMHIGWTKFQSDPLSV